MQPGGREHGGYFGEGVLGVIVARVDAEPLGLDVLGFDAVCFHRFNDLGDCGAVFLRPLPDVIDLLIVGLVRISCSCAGGLLLLQGVYLPQKGELI